MSNGDAKHPAPQQRELTPWFPGAISPERQGVYLRKVRPFTAEVQRYSYWNGKWWGGYSGTPDAAFNSKDLKSAYQECEWRGLAKEPKK